jgi:hypothetical protein
MFLHIMVGENPKNSTTKETTFYNFTWCDKVYLHKKMYITMYSKMKLYSRNYKIILIFMKFVVSTKHCESIWLEWVCEPCEKFDNFHITNGFFSSSWA